MRSPSLPPVVSTLRTSLSLCAGLLVLGAGFPAPANGADSPPAAARRPAREPFEFVNGDRIVLIGDTLIEREGIHGYIEARITAQYPDRHLIFRNLGWSADTPMGQSRVSFDWSKGETEWFRQFREQIAAVKPTVAIIGYGMANSFDGPAGLEKFKADLNRLADTINDVSKPTPVRFIFLSPIRHEALGAPFPDPTAHNTQLALYTRAIAEIAEARQARFISLFDSLQAPGTASNPPLTENGIHLNAYGYWRASEVIARDLGWKPGVWQFSIRRQGEIRPGSFGATLTDIQKTTNSVRLTMRPEHVDAPPVPVTNEVRTLSPGHYLQFLDLADGTYTLKIDGKPITTQPLKAWTQGVKITSGAPFDHAERLRQNILKKNELFFHRWRPQNQTYLFGFRKHEQGQNAHEVPKFDPLVAAEEERIATLRTPAQYTVELVRTDDDKNRASIETVPPAEPPAGGGAGAVPVPKNPQPRPTFTVAPGFEVNLYAESPQLAKPIQMNFDPQGRLWIASSETYPQIKPGQPSNDKILVLEDTNSDGVAEKSTVFADGLLIPTGVEPGDGGVYVGASTELLHLKDTDGDGRADQRRVVLSGFGTEDTHHILHTLRWGHDGQLYFNQSIYIHSHIETPHGVQRLNSGGIWRFRTDTLDLGVFLRGFCNPWGHHFDNFGQSFATDGAGFQGVSWGIEGATYFTYADMRREMKSVSPGAYPKFCGLEILESSHFPEDWQGSVITCDFRAHRIVRFNLAETGAGYGTTEMPDVLRTTNVTFRPIDVKLGPDGALYVADWSNPIIQHGEVDFRDPRRDKENGRIWRITASNRPLNPRRDFTRLSNQELLDSLRSPNNYDRQRARRVLIERGKEKVLTDLGTWTSQARDERSQLEALWMYQALDVLPPDDARTGVMSDGPDLLNRVLGARDPRIRAAGIRVVRYWHNRLPNAAAQLAKATRDDHPRVRVEAVRALSQIPGAQSATQILGVLDTPMDDFLNYALWLSINDLAVPWTEAVQSGAWKIEGREKQLEFALQSIKPQLAAPVLARLLETTPIPADGSGPWIDLIGKAGSEKELRLLLDAVLQQRLQPSASSRALSALASAARTRKTKPGGDLTAIRPLLQQGPDDLREQATAAAGAWRLETLKPEVLKLVADNSPRIRQAALASLREIGGADVFASLEKLAAQGNDPMVRTDVARTLAAVDLKRSLPVVFEVLAALPNENGALELWRHLLANKGAAKVVTQNLPKDGLPPAVARTGVRVAREAGRSEPELVLALARAGGLEDDARELTPAEIQQMVANVQQSGDPARGEQVYRRLELACVSCHAIGGVGGKVGPDMTSIGASAPIDYLIESLLFPNRKIKEGYHSVVVETADGLELSGIVVRENTEQLVLRDATNREVTLAKDQISRRVQGGSLMPSGLLDGLAAPDQLDLFRFLSELGKPGRYDASRGNVARLWRLRPFIHTDEQVGDAQILARGTTGNDWKPLNALVDGRVTAPMVRDVAQTSKYVGFTGIYAAAQFQVARAGKVRLNLVGGPAYGVWINGQPAAVGDAVSADLGAGVHTLVIKLDPKNLPEILKLDTNDATFLTN